MDDADRATDELRIIGIRTRMLRRAIAFVEREIVEHGFSGDTSIAPSSEGES
jgi:hypothetical protein